VLVATIRAMKMNGGTAKADLGQESVDAVKEGCANLGRHIGNLKSFGVPVVVAVNHFVTDTDAEVQAVQDYVATQGAEAIVSRHWEFGSEGSEPLARRVAEIAESGASQFAPLYKDELSLFEKIETVAKRIYHADEVLADKKIRDQLKIWEDAGYGHLPVCMAKTQYSFTTDPSRRGAPTGHSVPVREVRLAAGAGFVVVVCGEIMTMPGLPSRPAAENIHLNEDGQIEGLF
jgi:formate--tetrahydrofolate ligase